MARFSVVFLAKMGTCEGNEADILARLIEEYENKMFPIDSGAHRTLSK